jgi:hypothetical protein
MHALVIFFALSSFAFVAKLGRLDIRFPDKANSLLKEMRFGFHFLAAAAIFHLAFFIDATTQA